MKPCMSTRGTLSTSMHSFSQKKEIAKALNIKDLCSYLGIRTKGTMLYENTSVRFFDNFTRFMDFSCQEQYGHGDVISFWNYIEHYMGSGISEPVPFKDAVEEVYKIHCEINPSIALSMENQPQTEKKTYKPLPLISPKQLNREMAGVLQEKLFGFDKSDPKYIEAIDKPKEYFEKTYGMSKRDYLVMNCRNQFMNNLSGGFLGHDDYKEDEIPWKKTNYLHGYLQVERGISEETVDKFIDMGYLVQTTGKWSQRQGVEAETTLENGVSQTTYKGKKWKPVEKGYMYETYSFYNVQSHATWLSYDKDGNLNSMWSRGFYNGSGDMRKPQFSYGAQHRDKFQYKEHPFLFDPECPLSLQNAFVNDMVFEYIEQPVAQTTTPNTDKPLVVFESTIDTMSFYDMLSRTGQNPDDYAYCSLNGAGKVVSGLKDIVEEFGYKDIVLCLDNDRTGTLDAMKAKEYFENEMGCSVKDLTSEIEFPIRKFVQCKDMNECLLEFNEGNWNFPNIQELLVKEEGFEK